MHRFLFSIAFHSSILICFLSSSPVVILKKEPSVHAEVFDEDFPVNVADVKDLEFQAIPPSGQTRSPFRPSDAVSTSCSEGFDNVAFEGFPPTNSSHHATFCIPNMCLFFFLPFEKCNQPKGVAKRTVRHQSVGRSRKENLSAFNCRNPTRQSRSFLMTRPTPSRAYPLWRPIKNSRVSKLNKFNSGSVKCRRSVA